MIGTGAGAAAMGHPATLRRVAGEQDERPRHAAEMRGDAVLSGALTAAVDAKPGDRFRMRFDRLGEVAVAFASARL